MISLKVILIILFTHWIADFVCQTDEEAKGKSTSNKMLYSHVFSYSAIWMLPAIYLVGWMNMSIFVSITFFFHWITDYYTSRLNRRLLEKGNTHNFFVSVGFDQILHYIQLFLTYLLLS